MPLVWLASYTIVDYSTSGKSREKVTLFLCRLALNLHVAGFNVVLTRVDAPKLELIAGPYLIINLIFATGLAVASARQKVHLTMAVAIPFFLIGMLLMVISFF